MVVVPHVVTTAGDGPATAQSKVTPGSASLTCSAGVRSLTGALGPVITGAGGGVVSRCQVTDVELRFPDPSVAVTTRVYTPSAKPVVSNVPFAGQAPENTVLPPGDVSTHVRVAPASVSLIVSVTVRDRVSAGGADRRRDGRRGRRSDVEHVARRGGGAGVARDVGDHDVQAVAAVRLAGQVEPGRPGGAGADGDDTVRTGCGAPDGCPRLDAGQGERRRAVVRRRGGRRHRGRGGRCRVERVGERAGAAGQAALTCHD